MRTTIRLNDELLNAAKQYAQARRTTLTAVIEDALLEKLSHSSSKAAQRKSVKLTTVGGNGLQAGIDLDDTSSLLDLMDDQA